MDSYLSDPENLEVYQRVAPHLEKLSNRLSSNAETVLTERYLRRGPDRKPIEDVDQMVFRVAHHVAKLGDSTLPAASHLPTEDYIDEVTIAYNNMIARRDFLPNSPTFTGAGTPIGQLAACFVLPIGDDMGGRDDGIFQTLRDAALIQKTGGGVGFSFSDLRAKGSIVASSGGMSSGPVNFLGVYDKAFGAIAQGGTRRGANMAVMDVSHPDIEEFISCKTSEGNIANFNISVGISDTFMEAVMCDGDFDLVHPNTKIVAKTVRAAALFDRIVEHAHRNGEPGVLFLDEANRHNPVPKLYTLKATNPCGEQYLGPYENCCLGSINLANFLLDRHYDGGRGPHMYTDLPRLSEIVATAVTFLDNVITANSYVPQVPALRKAALETRRIGLSIMGLHDHLIKLEYPYDSETGRRRASAIMEFIQFHSIKTSVELARKHGKFPACNESRWTDRSYLERKYTWVTNNHEPPSFVSESDWRKLIDDIMEHGVRNATLTTIAPTGTIGTVADVEGYGCEPIFSVMYKRNMIDENGVTKSLSYHSRLLRDHLMSHNDALTERGLDQVFDFISENGGSCSGLLAVMDAKTRKLFETSGDISPRAHVGMQAELQKWVCNSISKTCNFPSTATVEDVRNAYVGAWKSGCKGLTVYVTGSRDKVVLESSKEIARKEKANLPQSPPTMAPPNPSKKRMRTSEADVLDAKRIQISSPLGKVYITVSEDAPGEPYEVFVNVGKAGTETSAVSEAIGRLISTVLRMDSQVSPMDRMIMVRDQLVGIGGRRSSGKGPNRVLSVADGIGKGLDQYISKVCPRVGSRATGDTQERANLLASVDDLVSTAISDLDHLPSSKSTRDLCNNCGEADLVFEEGCARCYSCNHSECT